MRSEWYITSICSIYSSSHDYAKVISEFSMKMRSEWYITSICSIYSSSHDYAKVIFKLSIKMRSEWYITSLGVVGIQWDPVGFGGIQWESSGNPVGSSGSGGIQWDPARTWWGTVKFRTWRAGGPSFPSLLSLPQLLLASLLFHFPNPSPLSTPRCQASRGRNGMKRLTPRS
jgi:hypothetical protein